MKNEWKRFNNKGMSLVELLIAVVILAVIVVPLLHAFVTSSKVNAKAKSKLRQTAVAQDIMEGLKAYSVEDLVYQFNYPNINLNEYSLSFNIVKPELIEDGKAGLSSHIMELEADAGTKKFFDKDHTADNCANWSIENFNPTDRMDMDKPHTFKQRSSGKYYFAIKNMTLADTSVSDNKYMENSYVDVLIEADADAGKFKDAPGAATHEKYHYNSADFINIPAMDSYVDAFFVEDSSNATNEAAAKFFKNKYPAEVGTLPLTDIVPKLKKKIKLTVKETASATRNHKDRFEVVVDTTYLLNGDTSKAKAIQNQVYDNYATDEVLENVYMFYNPIYHTSDYSLMKDEITYDVSAAPSLHTNLYIIKQGSLSAYETKENDYNCTVTVNPSDSVNSVRTNLGYNLKTGALITAAWTKNVFTGCGTAGADGKPAKVLPLKGEEKMDRIYECKIYLFDKGTIDGWISGTPYDDLEKDSLTMIEGNMK